MREFDHALKPIDQSTSNYCQWGYLCFMPTHEAWVALADAKD